MRRCVFIILSVLLLSPSMTAQVRSSNNPTCESNCDIYKVREFHSDQYGSLFRLYATSTGKAQNYWFNKDLLLVAYDRNHNRIGQYSPNSLLAIENDNSARVLAFGDRYSYDPQKSYLDIAILFPSVPSSTAYVSVIEPSADNVTGWYWKNVATSSSRSTSSSEPFYIIHSVKHRFVKTDEGEQLRFTVDATITGCKGKSVYFTAFPYRRYDDGSAMSVHNNTALSNVNTNGMVYASSKSFTCSNDQVRWKDITLDVPARRVSHLKGTENYYVVIRVVTGNDNMKINPDHPQPKYYFSINWPSDNKYNDEKLNSSQMYAMAHRANDAFTRVDWLEAAGKGGNIDAMRELTTMYKAGYGDEIRPSLSKAEYWTKQYVAKVPYSGLVNNAQMLDEINALKRFRAGNKNLSALDYYHLAYVFQEGDFGETKNTDRALLFMEKAYRMGEDVDSDDLAEFYDEVAFDYVLNNQLDKAMDMGMNAIRLTGSTDITKSSGEGTYWEGYQEYEKNGDYRKAFDFYRVGAAFGSDLATAALARYYAEGIYVSPDIDKAFALIKSAKQLGYKDPNNRYDAYQRRINERNYAYYDNWQREAQNHYKQENRNLVAGLVVTGAIIAGIVSLVSNAGRSSSSSSSYSSSSSSNRSSYSSSSSSSYSSSSSSSHVCPDCTGRGMMNCMWCHGRGYTSGFFSGDEVCFRCEGSGRLWCWHCNGKGSIRD